MISMHLIMYVFVAIRVRPIKLMSPYILQSVGGADWSKNYLWYFRVACTVSGATTQRRVSPKTSRNLSQQVLEPTTAQQEPLSVFRSIPAGCHLKNAKAEKQT